MDKLTMYIILRRDLTKNLNWPSGSIIAQACHASTAALYRYRELPNTIEYMSSLDSMTKVVLETKNETGLKKVEKKLEEMNIPFYKWVEQPEGLVTCLATAPVKKAALGEALKGCSLYKS